MVGFGIADLILIYNEGKGSSHDLAVVYDVWDSELQLLLLQEKPNGCSSGTRLKKSDLSEGELTKEYFIDTRKKHLVNNSRCLQKVGRIGIEKMDEIIRQIARDTAEKHFQVVHSKASEFVEGKTNVRYGGRVYDAEEMKSLVDASLDFWLTSGRFAKQFEKEFAKFLGTKHCMLTNSGSSANLLAVSSLTSPTLGARRLTPGDEVITTACAFPTTVNPIVQNGLLPVFLDVDLETYNVQAEKIEAALTKKTKAIICAHTLGNPFDLASVRKVCSEHKLWLIEDCCDALGSKYAGQNVGTFGDIVTFSFYPPHHMTMGEGGALATGDNRLKVLIESFRDWGRDCWCEPGADNTCEKRFQWQLGSLPYGYDHKYIYSHIGYNLKITDMQAAVGVAQLKKLPGFIETRKTNWQILFDGLKKHENFFVLPKATSQSDPCWFGFVLTVKEDAPFARNDVTQYLEKNKIATRLVFSGNLTRHPSFADVKYRVHDGLENTDFVMNNSFWIGVYPGITKTMIDYVLRKFDEFIEGKK